MTDFKIQNPDLDSDDLKHWYQLQLESALFKLIKNVNVLAYTRNPSALSETAAQCDAVQAVLDAYEKDIEERSLLNMSVEQPTVEETADYLFLIETHQLLSEARRLVRAPLEPVWRDGNVIELKPNYSELTDAAFERMLASSDIPQFLSTPASSSVNDCMSGSRESDKGFTDSSIVDKKHLRLVHSNSNFSRT